MLPDYTRILSFNLSLFPLVFGHVICHFSYIFDLGLYVQYFLTFFLNIKKKKKNFRAKYS